jgi:hypothetical protein
VQQQHYGVNLKMHEEEELQKIREQEQIKQEHINKEQGFSEDHDFDSRPLSLEEYNEQRMNRNQMINTPMNNRQTKNRTDYITLDNDDTMDSVRKRNLDQMSTKKSSNVMRFRRVAARSNTTANIEHLQTLSNTLNDPPLQEEIRKLIFHEENMDIMNPILEQSAVLEEKLMSKIGDKAFSTVAKHDRRVKRDDDRYTIDKMLAKIHQRTQATKSIEEKRRKPKQKITATSIRRKWIDETKTQALHNLNEQEQKKRIEDIVIVEREKQERAAEEYKHNIDKINDEKRIIEMKNKTLMTTIAKLEDEITSLKYTINLLRQKLSRVTSREVESQQKLKLFSDYEPLFEDLRKKFNFENPQQVIQRMELLEKAQADSYNQLLEAQEQRNQMERLLEKTKQDAENKNRERLLSLTKNLERSERQAKELQKNVDILEKAKEKADAYNQRYMDLNRAIADIWNTWFNDIENIGHRSDIVDDPDTSDSHQTIAAIKNILIAFTPSKAGRTYVDLSILANNYWRRYFQEDISLKGQPSIIFERLGDYIDGKNKEIKQLKGKIAQYELSSKDLTVGLSRANREKRAAEQALVTHRLFHKTRQSNDSMDGFSSGRNTRATTVTTDSKHNSRPMSAPMYGRRIKPKIATVPSKIPLTNSSRIAIYSAMEKQPLTPAKSPRSQIPSSHRKLLPSTPSQSNIDRLDRNETLSRIKYELQLSDSPTTAVDSSTDTVFITQNQFNQ